MNYKNMTKEKLIKKLKLKDDEIAALENGQEECCCGDCDYECDECYDLQNELNNKEDTLQEAEQTILELESEVEELKGFKLDVLELQDISNTIENALHDLDNIVSNY